MLELRNTIGEVQKHPQGWIALLTGLVGALIGLASILLSSCVP